MKGSPQRLSLLAGYWITLSFFLIPLGCVEDAARSESEPVPLARIVQRALDDPSTLTVLGAAQASAEADAGSARQDSDVLNDEGGADATSSDATSSDVTSSDATSSDATSSDATSSDATSSDATSSDATSSDATSSDVGSSELSGAAQIEDASGEDRAVDAGGALAAENSSQAQLKVRRKPGAKTRRTSKRRLSKKSVSRKSSGGASLGKVPAPTLAPSSSKTAGLGATDLYYQGKDQLRSGNARGAIESLSASQRLRSSKRTLALLGQAYFDAGQLKAAEKTLRAARTHPGAMLLLAMLYQQQGKTSLSRKVYTAFLATHPQHRRAAWVRGILRSL